MICSYTTCGTRRLRRTVLLATAAALGAQGSLAADIDAETASMPMAAALLTASNVTTDGDALVVTGTRLPDAALAAEARVPVQVIGREEIEEFGFTQVSDLLRAIPSNFGSEMFTEASPRAGQSQFNLRGLGYTSTLTLVNGRRAGVSPLSDETGAEFVDINQFPLSMIGRIEVLKDGASAIYGSDAVAGVVNIITRRGFDGLEVSGAYQNSEVNESGQVSFALGQTGDRGFISVYGTAYRQTRADRSDFDWLMARVGGNGVPGRSQFLNGNGAPGTYRPGGRNAAGQPIGLPDGVGFADPDCEAAGGVFRIRDNGAVDRNTCLIDFTDQAGIIPEATRIQLFSEFEYEVSDNLTFFAEASFSRNVLKSTKGPGSFSNGSVVEDNEGDVFIPGDHPFNFFVADPADPNRLVYLGPEGFDPAVHTAADLVTSSRIFGAPYFGEGAGDRRSQTDYTRVVSGFDWELPREWAANLSYQFAAADFTDEQPFRFNAAALNAAILEGRLNPFGSAVARPDLVSPKDGTSRAANSEAILAEVMTTSIDRARTEQHVVDAGLAGPVFDLPAGPLGLAVGAQYRRVTLREIPDALQATAQGDRPTEAFPIRGDQTVRAAYAELALPVTERFDMQLALRYEDYSENIGSSVDPKLALRYSPVDAVTLRGSISTSFQAPTLRQTSESLTRVFINDPTTIENGALICRDTGRTTNAIVRTSGGESLDPQSSTNYSIGIVVNPAPGLHASVDYWRYEYDDLIAAGVDAQAIIDNDCADGRPDDPRIIRAGSGLVAEVNTAFINVGKVVTDGLDLSASYTLATDTLGRFEVSADATYVNKFDVTGAEGGSFDGVGSRNFANNFRSMPQWRAVGNLRWERGDFGGALALRFIDSYKNDQSNDAPIKSYTTVDLSLSYALRAFNDDNPLVLTVGADNLFNRNPPALRRYDDNGEPIPDTAFNYIDRPGYDAFGGADLRGRVLYVHLKQML